MTIKTPWELAASGREHGEQVALFAWANFAAQFGFEQANDEERWKRDIQYLNQGFQIPQLKRLFAIHNQGHGDKIRGAAAKAEGVKAGVCDIMLPVAKISVIYNDHVEHENCGLFIELKRKDGKSSDVSTEQLDWIAYLNDAGYKATVAFGWEQAAKIIQEYLL